MARITARVKELTEQDIAALVDIGTREAALVDRIEEALLRDDTQAVIDLARRLVGLDKEALTIGGNPLTQ